MVTTIMCAADRYINPAGYPCEPCECYCHTMMDEPDEFTEGGQEFTGFSHDPFDSNYAPDEYHTTPRDSLCKGKGEE